MSETPPDFVREWAAAPRIPRCPGLNADGMCPYGYGVTCCAVSTEAAHRPLTPEGSYPGGTVFEHESRPGVVCRPTEGKPE